MKNALQARSKNSPKSKYSPESKQTLFHSDTLSLRHNGTDHPQRLSNVQTLSHLPCSQLLQRPDTSAPQCVELSLRYTLLHSDTMERTASNASPNPNVQTLSHLLRTTQRPDTMHTLDTASHRHNGPDHPTPPRSNVQTLSQSHLLCSQPFHRPRLSTSVLALRCPWRSLTILPGLHMVHVSRAHTTAHRLCIPGLRHTPLC